MKFPPLALGAWLRYDSIEHILKGLTDVRSVLEIGAGLGGTSVRLAQRYEYLGIEADRASYEVCSRRLEQSGRGRVLNVVSSELQSIGDTFDMVCAFEVLEHIEDDVETLRSWRKFLRPGGRIFLSVPAFQNRYGASDELAGHFRRYERDDLKSKLGAAGFEEIKIQMYGYPLGYLLEIARNSMARISKVGGSCHERTSGSGRWMQPPDWLGWATQMFTAPFRVLQRPFRHTNRGTGFLALARRTD